MSSSINLSYRRERVSVPLLCLWMVIAGGGPTFARAADQDSFIMFRLAKDIALIQQQSVTDSQVKGNLDALAQTVPQIASSLDQRARKSDRENTLEALYGINREFSIDVRDTPAEQRDALMQALLSNPLVISAEMAAAAAESEKDSGQLLSSARRSAAADATQPSYRQGPAPAAGYRIGGINSEAASNLPGGNGERARVVIASDNYWDRSHENLPSLPFSPISGPQRLSCSTYYTVGNYANAAAGIITGKDNGAGIVGIVPQAQLTAVPATFASIYNEIYNVGLQPGDVVVLDPTFSSTTSGYGDFVPYPGDTCPKARPSDQSTRTCQLPSVGYESTQRRVEILTEEMGVHVVVNTSGGIAFGQDPATPLNLDHADFNGLFDRDRNDDGAIYVSSIEPRTGNSLAANYGARVDLSTWGTHITYPSYQAGAGHNTYSRYDREDALNYRFSAYIVAGAVAQIQSIAFAKGLGPVPPKVMRRLLVETGHAFPDQAPGKNIGRQPDVKAAVDKMLADYSQGFPPEPPEPFHIKRVLGSGAPFHGRSWGYRPIVAPTGMADVTYHWDGLDQDPLESPRVDPSTGELLLGVGWSKANHNPTIKLVATDRLGNSDHWSRTLDIPRLVWWHSGEWKVPEVIESGQTVSFSAKINSPPRLEGGTDEHYFYWKAPGLFSGTRVGNVSAREPYTLTITAPEVTRDEQVRVQLLGTEGELRTLTQVASAQPGIFFSQMVTLKAGGSGGGPSPTGVLKAPASVVGNGHYLFKVDEARDPAGGALTYQWTLPEGFANPGNSAMASGFVPGTDVSKAVTIEVLVSNAQGKSLTLREPLSIVADLPSGDIEGPATITMGSGESREFVVKATLPDGAAPTFNWSKPGGFVGTLTSSDRITLTAPQVDQPLQATVSVIVSGRGTSQVVYSRAIRVEPRSAANPPAEACATPWSASTAYATPGVRVSYDGYNYEVAHWTQGNQPDKNFVLSGSAKPWRQVGSCSP